MGADESGVVEAESRAKYTKISRGKKTSDLDGVSKPEAGLGLEA